MSDDIVVNVTDSDSGEVDVSSDTPINITQSGSQGADGKNIELQKGTTYIQWKYTDDVNWIDLVALADITGANGTDGIDGTNGIDGVDGKEVEIQNSGTYIQWRYVGDLTWINIIAIADLKGDKGDKGEKGDTGLTGATGATGSQGVKGDTGAGVAIGGTTGQLLKKKSNTDYDTEWLTPPYLSTETDPLSLHLDQNTPQTVIGLSDGYLKLTSGVVGTGVVDLSGYVPYTGATTNLNLGSYSYATTGRYYTTAISPVPNGYAAYKTISIPAPTVQLTGFRQKIVMTNDALVGARCLSSGYDIKFFSDIGFTTELPTANETFTKVGSLASGVWYVQVTRPITTATVIYCAYGKASATNTWVTFASLLDSSYNRYYRMQGITDLVDYKNANTLVNSACTTTATGTPLGATAGITKAISSFYTSGGNQYLTSADTWTETKTYQLPPAQNTTYVKALTEPTGYLSFYATDPALSVTGAALNNAWKSTANTNQTIHIDLGSAKIVDGFWYENYHDSGTATTNGGKNFSLYGSNTASAFTTLAYATNTNWTAITTDVTQLVQHTASNVADPHYIKLIPSPVAYRYYRIRIADAWGGAGFMGLRRLEFYSSTGTSSTGLPIANTARTFTAYYNTGDYGTVKILFDYGESGANKAVLIYYQNGYIRFNNSTTEYNRYVWNNYSATSPYSRMDWTYDGAGTLKYYLNGALQQTWTGVTLNTTTLNALAIGKQYGITATGYQGNMLMASISTVERSAPFLLEDYKSDTNTLVLTWGLERTGFDSYMGYNAVTNAFQFYNTGFLNWEASLTANSFYAPILSQGISDSVLITSAVGGYTGTKYISTATGTLLYDLAVPTAGIFYIDHSGNLNAYAYSGMGMVAPSSGRQRLSVLSLNNSNGQDGINVYANNQTQWVRYGWNKISANTQLGLYCDDDVLAKGIQLDLAGVDARFKGIDVKINYESTTRSKLDVVANGACAGTVTACASFNSTQCATQSGCYWNTNTCSEHTQYHDKNGCQNANCTFADSTCSAQGDYGSCYSAGCTWYDCSIHNGYQWDCQQASYDGCTWADLVPCSTWNGDSGYCNEHSPCYWNSVASSCTGTPDYSCTSYTNPSDCAEMNCTWNTPCTGYTDQSNCEANSCNWTGYGCSGWNNDYGGCVAMSARGCGWSGTDCHSWDTDMYTCQSDEGCTWDGGGNFSSCGGTMNDCTTWNNDGSTCTGYSYFCTWDAGGTYTDSCTGSTTSCSTWDGDGNETTCASSPACTSNAGYCPDSSSLGCSGYTTSSDCNSDPNSLGCYESWVASTCTDSQTDCSTWNTNETSCIASGCTPNYTSSSCTNTTSSCSDFNSNESECSGSGCTPQYTSSSCSNVDGSNSHNYGTCDGQYDKACTGQENCSGDGSGDCGTWNSDQTGCGWAGCEWHSAYEFCDGTGYDTQICNGGCSGDNSYCYGDNSGCYGTSTPCTSMGVGRANCEAQVGCDYFLGRAGRFEGEVEAIESIRVGAVKDNKVRNGGIFIGTEHSNKLCWRDNTYTQCSTWDSDQATCEAHSSSPMDDNLLGCTWHTDQASRCDDGYTPIQSYPCSMWNYTDQGTCEGNGWCIWDGTYCNVRYSCSVWASDQSGCTSHSAFCAGSSANCVTHTDEGSCLADSMEGCTWYPSICSWVAYIPTTCTGTYANGVVHELT